jgi:hypothetical protein
MNEPEPDLPRYQLSAGASGDFELAISEQSFWDRKIMGRPHSDILQGNSGASAKPRR